MKTTVDKRKIPEKWEKAYSKGPGFLLSFFMSCFHREKGTVRIFRGGRESKLSRVRRMGRVVKGYNCRQTTPGGSKHSPILHA